MRVTFNSTGMPLSMGLFFSLLVLGLNAKVPAAMFQGLVSEGVPRGLAAQLGHLPPLGYLFAAFLGLNPLKTLLGPKVLAHLSAAHRSALVGRSFFPQLIGGPFKHALVYVLAFAIAMSLVAAVASAMRGAKFIHEDDESRAQKAAMTGVLTEVPDGLGAEAAGLAGNGAIVGKAELVPAPLGAPGGQGA